MGNNRSKVPDLEKLVKGGRKKFVRYEEGAMLYSMGVHTFQQLAKDARAVYHIYKLLVEATKDGDINHPAIYQWRRKYVRQNKSGVVPTLTANQGEGGHNVCIVKGCK